MVQRFGAAADVLETAIRLVNRGIRTVSTISVAELGGSSRRRTRDALRWFGLGRSPHK